MAGPRRNPSQPQSNLERLVGVHPVREALRAGRRELVRLRVRSRPRAELLELVELARERGVAVEEVEKDEQLGRSEERNQGVVLEAGPLPELQLEQLLEERDGPRWIVALDGVEDPQNVGAVVRVAEAAGACGLVLTRRRAPPLSASLARASAGAIEHLLVARVPNLAQAINTLKEKGFWVCGADAREGEELFAVEDRFLTGNLVLILGAEGRGLRPGVADCLDRRLRIPLAGKVDSLNVATAAAVLLFDWVRRARLAGPA